MKTWIFQGNPKNFNVDDYLLENQLIWWSIRQEHFAKDMSIGDEVFIWRSDGNNKCSGGVVARCKLVSLPQRYTNDDRDLKYWYDVITYNTYLAAELEVLEVEVATGLKRIKIQEDEILSGLPILKLRQNTNYLLNVELGSRLRQLWYARLKVAQETDKETYTLPPLKPSGRSREYKHYSDDVKASVLYEHLVNDEMHRWLDINVLGITSGNTKGRNSANILYYLGMKADYRGIFEGEELDDVIQILEKKGEAYEEATRLLKLLDHSLELEESINADIEAELVEEGVIKEGQVKYYYGKRYERDMKNRALAIQKHGFNCFACDFNFEKGYGERGKYFIEVHHVKPLSTLEEAMEVNPETDLVPLCANCHRMVHRRQDDVLSVEELRGLIGEL